MSYVLTWPSEYGPCMLRVSRRTFVARSHADLRVERSYGVLRYPPPGWVHVITERSPRPSLAGRVARLVCIAALCGVCASVGYQVRGVLARSEVAPVQPLPQPVSLRRLV